MNPAELVKLLVCLDSMDACISSLRYWLEYITEEDKKELHEIYNNLLKLQQKVAC